MRGNGRRRMSRRGRRLSSGPGMRMRRRPEISHRGNAMWRTFRLGGHGRRRGRRSGRRARRRHWMRSSRRGSRVRRRHWMRSGRRGSRVRRRRAGIHGRRRHCVAARIAHRGRFIRVGRRNIVGHDRRAHIAQGWNAVRWRLRGLCGGGCVHRRRRRIGRMRHRGRSHRGLRGMWMNGRMLSRQASRRRRALWERRGMLWNGRVRSREVRRCWMMRVGLRWMRRERRRRSGITGSRIGIGAMRARLRKALCGGWNLRAAQRALFQHASRLLRRANLLHLHRPCPPRGGHRCRRCVGIGGISACGVPIRINVRIGGLPCSRCALRVRVVIVLSRKTRRVLRIVGTHDDGVFLRAMRDARSCFERGEGKACFACWTSFANPNRHSAQV